MANAIIGYDNLFNEGYPKTKRYLALTSGQSVVRGEVLAIVTATGKLETYTDAGKSTKPFFGISPDDYDATEGELGGVEVITGCEVNANALIFSASGDTADETFVKACRLQGVHIVPFRDGSFPES